MTNHLFELAGNRKTETVIPKSGKTRCFGSNPDSYRTGLPVCGTDHDKGSCLYGSVKL